MDTPARRRSRMVRDRRSRPLAVSERDIEILRLLARYRYLRSSYIEAFVGGNSTALRWRLRELFDAGYIRRPPAQWEVANARSLSTVYALATKGLGRLEELGLVNSDGGSAYLADGGHYWHTVLASEIMASFEIEARTHELELISETDILERLAQARNDHLNPRAFAVASGFIVPDGLFGLRTPTGVTLYALEVDRGQEPLARRGAGSTYREKFNKYQELIDKGLYKQQLSTPAPLVVLHVTGSEQRKRSLMRLVNGEHFHCFAAVQERVSSARPLPVLGRATWCRCNGSGFAFTL